MGPVMAWKYCPHCGEHLEGVTPPPANVSPPSTAVIGNYGPELVSVPYTSTVVGNISSGSTTFKTMLELQRRIEILERSNKMLAASIRPPDDPPPAGVREPRRPIPGAPGGYV